MVVNLIHTSVDECRAEEDGDGNSVVPIVMCDQPPARCASDAAPPPRKAPASVSYGAIARLHEWGYDDVGDECARLGAEGWMAAEVSPPALHLTLSEGIAAIYQQAPR